MGPTRISGPQGSQGSQGIQSTRGKAQTQQTGGPVDPSAPGGFLALLASLENTLAGDGLPADTVSDSSATETAILSSDNSAGRSGADPAPLAAWQSLLAPGAQPGAAVAGSAAAGGAGVSGLAGVSGCDRLMVPDALVAQTAISGTAVSSIAVAPASGGSAGLKGAAAQLASDGVEAQAAVSVAAMTGSAWPPVGGAAFNRFNLTGSEMLPPAAGLAVHGEILSIASAGSATSIGVVQGLVGFAGSETLLDPAGLVAQTAMLDGAVDVAGAKPPDGAMVSHDRMFSRHQNALSPGRGDVSSVVAGAAAGANRVEMKPPLVTAIAATQGAQAVVDSRLMGGQLVEAGSRGGIDLLGGLGGATGAPALDLFAENRLSQRGGSATSGDAGGRPSGDAAWVDRGTVRAGTETAGVEGAAAFAGPTQSGAEEQIAEQVAYWVNQKTQNAEMILDRDGQPVQVTVSLSGSEAHVTFRSDQAQTRELLDSSMSQLRDLLRDEGLVLSGTTVGTRGRDGASPNDSGQRQGREGERRAPVVASVPAAGASVRGPGGAPDRAVDIFV